MNDFLTSLKADLLDRRLLPFVALVGLALVAALAYVVLGGGSGTTPPAPAAGGVSAPKGIAVTAVAANPVKPVAETTSGSAVQLGGHARNPFTPLAGAAKSKSATSSSTSTSTTTVTHSSSSTTSAGSSTGANLGSGSSPKSEPKPATPSPSKPSKPKNETVYHVSTLFGVVPAVAPPQGVQLTPHDNLRLLTALPSAKQPLIVFRGVTTGGKSAIFTVVGEAILRGNATCLPSTSQCLAIELKPGQIEQLEYLPPSGEAITYELRVVSIAAAQASSAAVVSVRRASSNAGRQVLRRAGLLGLPGLRYTSSVGVLALIGHPASAARAHGASRHRDRG